MHVIIHSFSIYFVFYILKSRESKWGVQSYTAEKLERGLNVHFISDQCWT